MKNRAIIIVVLTVVVGYHLNAQVYTNKEVGKKNQD